MYANMQVGHAEDENGLKGYINTTISPWANCNPL